MGGFWGRGVSRQVPWAHGQARGAVGRLPGGAPGFFRSERKTVLHSAGCLRTRGRARSSFVASSGALRFWEPMVTFGFFSERRVASLRFSRRRRSGPRRGRLRGARREGDDVAGVGFAYVEHGRPQGRRRTRRRTRASALVSACLPAPRVPPRSPRRRRRSAPTSEVSSKVRRALSTPRRAPRGTAARATSRSSPAPPTHERATQSRLKIPP